VPALVPAAPLVELPSVVREPKLSGMKLGRSGLVLVGKPRAARVRSMVSSSAGSPEPVSSVYCPL
jgi:hypothetical protein